MTSSRRLLSLSLLAAALLPLPGCLVAAAGAGAAAAVAWTERGARSEVPGSVDEVFRRGVAVFADAGVTRTGEATEESGARRRLTGTRGELEVTVEIERRSDSTSAVEVYARRSPVEWDRDYARELLTRIVNRP